MESEQQQINENHSAYAPISTYNSWLYIRERLYAIFSLIWMKKEGQQMDSKVLHKKTRSLNNTLQELEAVESDIFNTTKLEISKFLDTVVGDLKDLEKKCTAILSDAPKHDSS